MNCFKKIIVCTFLFSACSGGESGADGGGGDSGGTGDLGAFQNFTPTTYAVRASAGSRISVSTVSGNIGCGLAQGFSVTPGIAGEQVFVRLNSVLRSNDTHAIVAANCQGSSSDSAIATECAVYRRWSATGELEAHVYATGGAITVTRFGDTSSKLELDIVFPGGNVFSDGFTISDDSECL